MSRSKDQSGIIDTDFNKSLFNKNNLWEKIKDIDLNDFIDDYKIPILLFLLGIILIGVGVFYSKNDAIFNSNKIEVISESTEGQGEYSEIVVEIAGAVEKPGVYRLADGARIDDLLIVSGGLSQEADRDWVEKTINRAIKLVDGQKILIKSINEQSIDASANYLGGNQTISSSQGSGFENLINVNTASGKELESLWGIGPVYGQSIIDHRPYSSVEDLLTSGALKKSVYEKVKELVTVY